MFISLKKGAKIRVRDAQTLRRFAQKYPLMMNDFVMGKIMPYAGKTVTLAEDSVEIRQWGQNPGEGNTCPIRIAEDGGSFPWNVDVMMEAVVCR